jgi:Mal s 1 allergenic protein-like
MTIRKLAFLLSLIFLFPVFIWSQTDTTLPGKGLAQHPFLYAGEWQNHSMMNQKMYVVRHGKIVWTYTLPEYGEFSDAVMLSNGNILFARNSGITEITHDKKIVWNYDAPEGTQIHSCQAIGLDSVFFCQNGLPAKAILINIKTGKILMEYVLQTKSSTDPKTVHGQFRHIRMTKAGTYLIAYLDLGKVIEYNKDWKPIWSMDAPSAWAAVRLKNGNTLISGNQHGYVWEVNPAGKIVWQLNKDDLPGIHLYTIQQVERLANGNTVICNWFGGVKKEDWHKVVQIIEVTPAKKVVWALRQWANPDLGPASCIQLLDQPGIPEDGDLER